MTAKLWTSAALSPYGNEYGGLNVLAATREEAIEKAKEALNGLELGYVPHQKYAATLLANVDAMSEVEADVVIDWSATKTMKP